MTLKTRRILFVIFILAFFIISTLVISYASGYKISLSNKRPLQKTGMLILDSEPHGAKIYLNGEAEQLFFKKYYNKKESFVITPAKIKNLKPGEYNVKIELDGYQSWEKKLKINPGIATFAEDVNLFKINLPTIVKEMEISNFSLSPDNKFLIADKKNAYLLDLKTEKEDFFVFNASSSESIQWAPSNKRFSIGDKIYQTDNKNPIFDLTGVIEKNNFRWGKNDSEIFFIKQEDEKKSTIYRFDLALKKSTVLFKEEKIKDFFIKDEYLFAIKENNKTASLNIYEINSAKLLRTIDIPSSIEYQFINPEHGLVNLYDKKRSILYLIDKFSYLPLTETINNLKYAKWIDQNRLLYANDFEIWLFNGNKKELITRLGSPINRILWHPSNNYVIYSTDNSIFSIELDDREKHNTTKIIDLEKISAAQLNKNGDTLYFYSEIGGQKGIFKMALQ